MLGTGEVLELGTYVRRINTNGPRILFDGKI
jgi:hypothetical protein